jgi:hypothetical protein
LGRIFANLVARATPLEGKHGSLFSLRAKLSLRHTIAGVFAVQFAANTYNLIEDGSCNELDDGSPTGFVTGAPNLGPIQDNGGSTFTHALLDGSPAIDAGNCRGITADQHGFTRPFDIPTIPHVDDGCDIGAYELDPSQSLPTAPVFLPVVLK